MLYTGLFAYATGILPTLASIAIPTNSWNRVQGVPSILIRHWCVYTRYIARNTDISLTLLLSPSISRILRSHPHRGILGHVPKMDTAALILEGSIYSSIPNNNRNCTDYAFKISSKLSEIFIRQRVKEFFTFKSGIKSIISTCKEKKWRKRTNLVENPKELSTPSSHPRYKLQFLNITLSPSRPHPPNSITQTLSLDQPTELRIRSITAVIIPVNR